jgi:hypothetical protein
MLPPKITPSPITASDVLMDHVSNIDFSSLPQVQLKPEVKQEFKQDTHNAHPLAEEQLNKAVDLLSSKWVNVIASYLSPEANKAVIKKQAIELCLKNTLEHSKQAEAATKQAENKLNGLKTEFEQIKSAVTTIQTLLQDATPKILSEQKKINENLKEIKALEPKLEPAFTKIHYTVEAAKAIDPVLIKQVLNPNQQSIEYIVLNKEKFVNNTELFIKASKIVQEGGSQLAELKQTLQEKLSAYEKIKAVHETFKQGLPKNPDSDQLKKADILGGELRKAIQEHNEVKAQIKPLEIKIEKSQEYLKYHDNWSKQTQDDVDTAKLIESKKQLNLESIKIIDELYKETSKIEPHLQKLALTENQVTEQEKEVLDKQLLSKTQQEALDYFKQEALKLGIPTSESGDTHSDDHPIVMSPELMPSPMAEMNHTEVQL